MDIRPILPSIRVPALVLHSRGDQTVSLEEAEFLAQALPNSRLQVLDRPDHFPWIGDVEEVADAVLDFVLSATKPRLHDRILTTILMTDIEGSTKAAAEMGDARWRNVIDAHDKLAEQAVSRHEGTLVKTLGDGILATFAGPSRAVACAKALQADASALGLSIRAGIHTGECERRDRDISGIAVNLAARILDVTPGGACHVSSVVRDLTAGADFNFNAAGVHAFKGIPGEWQLHAVT